MKLKYLLYLLVLALVMPLAFTSCEDKEDPIVKPDPDPDPNPTEKTNNEMTNEWIYDKMKRVYLWNDKLPSSPSYKAEPKDFFYGILYDYGKKTGDLFSWIEADKSKEKKDEAAGSFLGFTYMPAAYFENEKSENSSVGFFVTSVREGSDAEKQGLKRGQLIYKVDNTTITSSNYLSLLDKGSFVLSVYDNGSQVNLPQIQANSSNNSPIILNKVLEVGQRGEKVKVGYLMYNAFERGPGDGTTNYEYDIELINTIGDLSSKGVTEFVLDLRYNPGGYLTSAMALSSALVPSDKVPNRTEKIFLTEKYNDYFQDSLVNKYGKNALNEYFLDKLYGAKNDIPRLNLKRLYVIATENSASASEAVIHGLRPYMEIQHVGLTTVGKDKASITVQSNDKRILWQLQPLVSRLTNSEGDGNYINGLKPDIEVSEWEECYEMVDAYYTEGGKQVDIRVPLASPWKGGFKELGDENEPLLAAAIAHITGKEKSVSVKSTVSKAKIQVPHIKRDETRFKAIIDENKFTNLKEIK